MIKNYKSTSFVWYKILAKNNKVLMDVTSRTCYYAITQGSMPRDTTQIICYHHKDWTPYDADEFARWIKAVNDDLGYPVKYKGMGYKALGIDDNHHVIEYKLRIGKHVRYKYKAQLTSALMLVRYLWESGLNGVPDNYFKLVEEIPDGDPFYLMQLAHKGLRGNTNHSIRDGELRQFLTREELKNRDNHMSLYRDAYQNINSMWNMPKLNFKIPNDNKTLYEKIMKNTLNVYVVGGAMNYANWLPDAKVVKTLEEADLVMFTGGEDVDPSLYNKSKGEHTGSNLARDLMEKEVYEKATALGLPKIGICRGSQFLCVMAGGELVQHQLNPGRMHTIQTKYHGEINISSTHHQAAYPFNLPRYSYEILGWTKDASPFHLDGEAKELAPTLECEIVHYRSANALGIQGHPEFDYYRNDPANADSMKVLKTIFTNFINNNL